LQREAGLELLKEKIESLLSKDSTSVISNADVNLLQRSLFEVQMLAKQLQPNNETLKTVLNKQSLTKYRQDTSDTSNTTKTETIIDGAKEIALIIGLDVSEKSMRYNDLEFANSEHSIRDKIPSPDSLHFLDSSDSLSPSETAEKVAKSDMQKVNTNVFSTFILAILAGAFIALGGIYFTFATSQITVTSTFTQILGGLSFSMGLMFVVITGAQLFTGNNLGVMNIASRKLGAARLLKNWTIVYGGNFIGSVATAGVLYMSKAWTNNGYQFGIRALAIANHKVGLGFVDAFFLGILCNCLVCLAIWLAASGKKVSDKILAIMFPVAAFVAMGFEHSVANMYFLSFAWIIKNDPSFLSAMQTAGTAVNTSHITYISILHNLIPVTLGNIVGGSVFIGLMYWLAYLRNNKKEI
jgi:formate transporter